MLNLIWIVLLVSLVKEISTSTQHINLKNNEKRILNNGDVFSQRQSKEINVHQLKLECSNQYKVQADIIHFFYLQYDSGQRLNMNFFSPDISFGYLYNVTKQQKNLTNQVIKKYVQNFKQKLDEEEYLKKKISTNMQYKHFISFQSTQSQKRITKKQPSLIVIAIYIPSQRDQVMLQKDENLLFPISIVVIKNTVFLDQNTFQKPIQYSLKKNQTHSFHVNITSVLKDFRNSDMINFDFEQGQKQLVFHTIHLVGDFKYNISMRSYKFQKNKKQQIKSTLIQKFIQQYSYPMGIETLQQVSQEFINSQQHKKAKLQKKNIQIELIFEIICTQNTCNLISELELSSKIRHIIPGIPYIYSIEKFQIFAISNPLDLEVFLDINKKNGFPQYKICSTKSSGFQNSIQNQCIKELMNPTSTAHLFQVKESEDKIHAFGRNNQIIITPVHQAYCYKCSYFFAIYTDYDRVVGTITFKNNQAGLLVPEGNSVTKTLKRWQKDNFILYGLQSRLLLEKFSGKIQVRFQQIQLFTIHNLEKISQLTLEKIPLALNSKKQQSKYYSIDLKEYIQSKKVEDQKSSLNKIHLVSIKTQKNYPSTFYSFTIKIMLKDGVPYFNKQRNKVSVFKYLTQNLQTKSFGTIIINSNQISDIEVEIYGYCLQLNQTKLNLNTNKIQKVSQKVFNSDTKKYEVQKIENKKINLMANRIDILIQPEMCKSYTIKMINNASEDVRKAITYQILVSFIDSMILPLNNEVPGILKYPQKIIQVYQVYLPQKAQLEIWINFCRGAKSRMEIYKNKQALFAQNSDQKIKFTSDSQLQEAIYSAPAGFFYITIEFFGFSNILQYTILVKHRENEQGFYYTDLSKYESKISYEVKDGSFFSTTYQLYFSPIFLKHWHKDIQKDIQYFETSYFILESNSYPLLKRASSCKGQFFSDIVNHHEHFKQVKLTKDKLVFHPPKKPQKSDISDIQKYERGYYTYQYETSNPLSFLIIVPVVSKYKQVSEDSEKQLFVIPYWKFDKKSRQPYEITQLYNGKLYSLFQHWFISSLIWAEEIIDFHNYQQMIASFLVFICCLPATCLILVCSFKTKNLIEQLCRAVFNFFQGKQNRQSQDLHQQQISVGSQQNPTEDRQLDYDENISQNQIKSQVQQENQNLNSQNVERQILSESEDQQYLPSIGKLQNKSQSSQSIKMTEQEDYIDQQ